MRIKKLLGIRKMSDITDNKKRRKQERRVSKG